MNNRFDKDNDFLVAIREEDRRFIYENDVCSVKFSHVFSIICSLKLFGLLSLQLIVFVSLLVIHTKMSWTCCMLDRIPGTCDCSVLTIALVILLFKIRWSAFLYMQFSISKVWHRPTNLLYIAFVFRPLTPTILQIDSEDCLKYKASLCITSLLIIFEFNLYLLFILAATFRRWYSKTAVQTILFFNDAMTKCQSECVNVNGNDCCRYWHGWYPTNGYMHHHPVQIDKDRKQVRGLARIQTR